MIEIPTTLILGAGASAPYGYPLGNGLKRSVLSLVSSYANENSECFQNLDYPLQTYEEFHSKFLRSRQPSIDSFLSNQTEEFTHIGKIAIAEAISLSENKDLLENPLIMGNRKEFDQNDDWYSYLTENLFNGDLDENCENIGIITYNYDRSLEAILMESLISAYADLDVEEARKIINKIPIIHMYGRLDPLPWESFENSRHYGEKCSFEKLEMIGENITLVHESEVFQEHIDFANSILAMSNRAYFLGLDLYRNKANIELLDLTYLMNSYITATGFGLAPGEISQVNDFFTNYQQGDSQIKIPGFNDKFTITNHKTLDCIKTNKPF